MGKEERVIRVIERWCGARPERGSDKVRALWERHGPSGVPFDDEGAERLIRKLDDEFPGHRLRPVDVLELSVDGLIDAIPDSVAAATARRVTVAANASVAPVAPLQVELTDATIERLARRIAALIRPKAPRRPKRQPGASSHGKTAKAGSSKQGRRKTR